MALRIEDYALIGDTHTVALVGVNGSIDWLCLPRFDAPACFASLLGTTDNGFWDIAPRDRTIATRRRYRGPTLVLETEFETTRGIARLLDCMPPRGSHPRIVRVVEGVCGEVAMLMRFVPRFEYGRVRPWVSLESGAIRAVAGPDALELRADVRLGGDDFQQACEFTVAAGQRAGFLLTFHLSWEAPPPPIEPAATIAETETWWREWSGRSTYRGSWAEPVARSLITLKALTYEPTGGIVAAATTSLPEFLGGVRNWDYRYCWLRDAALTLGALISAGYIEEAVKWRDWALRAVAGDPEDLQIMYGLGGERRLDEYVLDWLPGYEQSRPVRVGNAASGQRQLDVYGEVIDAMFQARELGMTPLPAGWTILCRVADWVEAHWREPDEGLWEVRGPRRNFVHSKVMAWVAADRMVRAIEEWGSKARWSASGSCAPTFATRCAARATTPPATRSRSTTAQPSSTLHCCSSPRWAFSRPPTRASSAPSRPFSVSSCEMDSLCATSRTSAPRMGCRPVRASFSPAASGWSTPWP
jgi:GH15 family glucan-1,4-alpha-glucosidase